MLIIECQYTGARNRSWVICNLRFATISASTNKSNSIDRSPLLEERRKHYNTVSYVRGRALELFRYAHECLHFEVCQSNELWHGSYDMIITVYSGFRLT